MADSTTNSYLTNEEKAQLQQYVNQADEDAPFVSRCQLLLLYDAGTPPELAAAQIGITIQRARSFIRAFNRERMTLFPAGLFQPTSNE